MKKLRLVFLAIFFFLAMATGVSAGKLHPLNARLIKAGLMPYPKYYPEIPRIPASYAYQLYKTGKALFALISYHNKDQIVGGLWLTEGKYPTINPNKLPFKKGQCLVLY